MSAVGSEEKSDPSSSPPCAMGAVGEGGAEAGPQLMDSTIVITSGTAKKPQSLPLFETHHEIQEVEERPAPSSAGASTSLMVPERDDGMNCNNMKMNNGQELFDRSTEKSQLSQAYKHLSRLNSAIVQKTNFVLVSGEAGCGKTTVACSLKETVMKDGGYFCTGKFEPTMNNMMMGTEPYAAFVAAFTDFTNQVMARGQAKEIKAAIHMAVKTETSMLTNMIPALEEIIGSCPHRHQNQQQPQQAGSKLPPSRDSAMRFSFVFRLFLGAIATPERPLVLFLDDLHHADQCSLQLLSTLVSDVNTNDVMFLCSTSSDKLGDPSTNPVCLMLRQLEENHQLHINNIAISNLCIQAISQIVADLLDISTEKSEWLAAGILMKTSGNALFVVEYIRKLHSEGLLYFDKEIAEWTWDEEDVRRALNHTCVKTLLLSRRSDEMNDVPQQLQELLKVASCLGSRLDENILSRAMSAPVATYLKMGLQRNLLVIEKKKGNNEYYAFVNSHVQEAFYGLVEEEKRPEYHLAIGRRLLRNFSSEELDKHVFVVLNQLRRGSSLITSQKEKFAMANLCLSAGKKAVKASSFRPAAAYFSFGIGLLCRDCWKDEYEMSLDLHSSNAEVLYVLPDFERMDVMIQEVFSNSRNFNDQLRAWYVRVLSLGAQDRAVDAIKDGLHVLSELEETFPNNPTLGLRLFVEYRSIKKQLGSMTGDMIMRLPNMGDPKKLAAMQMLNLIFLNAYLAHTNLYPFIALRMVKLSLRYGLCEVSSFGFAMFGLLVSGISGSIDLGCRYGDLSLRILEKFQAKEWLPRVYTIAHGCLRPWKRPIGESLEPLLTAYRVGLETGDVEYALLAANMYCFNSIDTARSLADVDRDIVEFTRTIEFHQHDLALTLITPVTEMVRSLIGSFDYKEVLRKSQGVDSELAQRDDFCIAVVYYQRAMVAYTYNDLETAERLTIICYQRFKNLPLAAFEVCQLYSFIALVSISVVRANLCKAASRKFHLKVVRRTIKRLHSWVKQNPSSCYGKLFLLEAEMAAFKGDFIKAHGKYACALSMTKSANLLFEHAIQADRAGQFMQEFGEVAMARDFFRESRDTFTKWGAVGRANYLREYVGEKDI